MKPRIIHLFLFCLDIVLLSGAFYVLILFFKGSSGLLFYSRYLLPYFLICWLFVYLIFVSDTILQKTNLIRLLKSELTKFISFVAVLSIIIILISHNDISRLLFVGTLGLFFIFKILSSLWYFYFCNLNYKSTLRPVVIIGYNNVGLHLHRFIEKNDHLGIRSLGILDDIDALAELPKIGNIGDLEKIHKQTALLEAYIALPIYRAEQIKTLISVCERNGVRPNIIPNYLGVDHLSFKVNTIGDIPLLQIRYSPLDNYSNRFWKRVFDLTLSIFLLVLATPVLLLIALLVKLDSKGPVIYAPLRLGIDGKPFRVYKFRSMKTTERDLEAGSTVKNDPRITRLGRRLRKYNLDELPQLINVVRNEMSLVGPRPHRVHLNKVLQDRINSYMIRHIIKPGITGWAQVNGWRGPTDTRRQSKARTLHDLWYIENWTFGLDLYIMLLTVFNKKSTNAF